MTATLQLNLAEARALMLAAQRLEGTRPGNPGLDDVRALIEHLGIVQIDTISVVARSQYLVLWSRLGPYDPKLIDQLLYPERAVFEYWGHAASILPMRDYLYYRPIMRVFLDRLWNGRQHEWIAQNVDVMQQTLEMVRQRGPVASADFERPPDARRTGPWDWHGPKASRRALELLWTMGDLMVHSRRNGQKLYDLRERVLVEAFGDDTPRDDALPAREQRLRYFVRRTVEALGVALPAWLGDYYRLSRESVALVKAQGMVEELEREGAILPATVEGLRGLAYVTWERLPDLERLRAGDGPARTTLLSPFDSLIGDRARTRALFNYEVCFEAYVPPPKRRYGYYCLAILHRARLVGRLDAKLFRGERRLHVHAVYLEPDVAPTADLLDGLAETSRDLARFLGADAVTVERSEPEELAPALRERLAGESPL